MHRLIVDLSKVTRWDKIHCFFFGHAYYYPFDRLPDPDSLGVCLNCGKVVPKVSWKKV